MLTGQDDVPGGGVDLDPLEDAGVEKTPEHSVAEDGAAPGGEDQLAAGDGHRGDDDAGPHEDPERGESWDAAAAAAGTDRRVGPTRADSRQRRLLRSRHAMWWWSRA